jgi:hypothetical protein
VGTRVRIDIQLVLKRRIDSRDLVRRWRVVRVDLGRLGVSVAKELLDRAERLPIGREPSSERVAQIVECDHADAGKPAGILKAPGELAAIDRVTGLRMREDEIVV